MFENGDIARIEADDRPRAVGGRMVPTRWQGRCFDYREMDGCRIPTRAVVSWLLEDGSVRLLARQGNRIHRMK